MKRSNRLVILVGVLLAVVAFVAIVILLNNSTPGPTAQEQQATVLVAKEDIAIGDPVTPDKVETKKVPVNGVSGTRIVDPSQVSGRPALVAIAKGGQVSQETVGFGNGPGCISCQLQPGEKAIAFQVDRATGIDFLIQQGDHIDVVMTQKLTVLQPTADSATSSAAPKRFEPINGLSDARTVKTVLSNKRVLYVSSTKVKSAQPSATPTAAQQAPAQAQAADTTIIVVFAGTDQDAEVIKFAQNDFTETGSLTAVLRNTQDDAAEKTTGITIDLLVKNFGVPIPNIVQQVGPSPKP